MDFLATFSRAAAARNISISGLHLDSSASESGVTPKTLTVARAPAYAGSGLGPRLLAEGLRLLLANGARDVALTVEARNDRALELYRRFGFQIASRIPVLALDLGRR